MPEPTPSPTPTTADTGQTYLVTEAEAARLLGVSAISVRRWALDGRLARVSLGRLQRYRYADLLRVRDQGLPPKPRA